MARKGGIGGGRLAAIGAQHNVNSKLRYVHMKGITWRKICSLVSGNEIWDILELTSKEFGDV